MSGQEVWDRLNDALKPRRLEFGYILGDAHALLSDAVKAFDAHVLYGTSLICRASLETACYLYLSWKPIKDGLQREYDLTLGGDVRRVGFTELLQGIVKKGILSPKQIDALKRIQRNGNFIAHFASHTAAQITGLQKGTRVSREIQWRKYLTDEEQKRFEKSIGTRIAKSGLGEDDALDDLIDTASILLTLSRHLHFRAVRNSSGPGDINPRDVSRKGVI